MTKESSPKKIRKPKALSGVYDWMTVADHVKKVCKVDVRKYIVNYAQRYGYGDNSLFNLYPGDNLTETSSVEQKALHECFGDELTVSFYW